MRMKASDRGQKTWKPSPVQNVPNEVNMIPTTNFSEFSGTFVSGARITAPAKITSIPAMVAPIAAELMPQVVLQAVVAALLPKVITMKATSSPSRSTAL